MYKTELGRSKKNVTMYILDLFISKEIALLTVLLFFCIFFTLGRGVLNGIFLLSSDVFLGYKMSPH